MSSNFQITDRDTKIELVHRELAANEPERSLRARGGAKMNAQFVNDTAKLLCADHRGLFAMDNSNGTCEKRFATLGIPQTFQVRRACGNWL
jgi:hypothetical protein